MQSVSERAERIERQVTDVVRTIPRGTPLQIQIQADHDAQRVSVELPRAADGGILHPRLADAIADTLMQAATTLVRVGRTSTPYIVRAASALPIRIGVAEDHLRFQFVRNHRPWVTARVTLTIPEARQIAALLKQASTLVQRGPVDDRHNHSAA